MLNFSHEITLTIDGTKPRVFITMDTMSDRVHEYVINEIYLAMMRATELLEFSKDP